MPRIEKFEDLEVWQLARKICQNVEILFQTTSLGRSFAIRDQMERSSGSIMDNIAEGFGRDGNREFHNFLSYSKGSCNELKSQYHRALDKKLISIAQHANNLEIIQKEINKLGAFMHYLRKSEFKGQKFRFNEKQQ